jgi:hypothetical protein
MGEVEAPWRGAEVANPEVSGPDPTGPDATGPADPEFRDIARGDPGRYRLLQESLRRLAAGSAGPDLAEMAREVLSGRITLRRAMNSRAYAEAWYPYVERLIKAVDDQRRSGMTGQKPTGKSPV